MKNFGEQLIYQKDHKPQNTDSVEGGIRVMVKIMVTFVVIVVISILLFVCRFFYVYFTVNGSFVN